MYLSSRVQDQRVLLRGFLPFLLFFCPPIDEEEPIEEGCGYLSEPSESDEFSGCGPFAVFS